MCVWLRACMSLCLYVCKDYHSLRNISSMKSMQTKKCNDNNDNNDNKLAGNNAPCQPQRGP